jgi:hypothetical protein
MLQMVWHKMWNKINIGGVALTFFGFLVCYFGSFQYLLFFPFLLQNIVSFFIKL